MMKKGGERSQAVQRRRKVTAGPHGEGRKKKKICPPRPADLKKGKKNCRKTPGRGGGRKGTY